MTRLAMNVFRRLRGFTLLEMSIVLVIIGVVVGGGMTIFSASLQKRQLQETQFKLKAIQKALLDFRIANNRLPCPADVTRPLTDNYFGVEAGKLINSVWVPDAGLCTTYGTYSNDVLTGTSANSAAADFADQITDSGTITAGSNSVSGLSNVITAGMSIVGNGIPPGDYVTGNGFGGTVYIAMAATASATVGLNFYSNVEGMVPTTTLHLPDDYAIDGWGRRIMYTVDARFTANGALVPYATSPITMKGTTNNTVTITGLTSTSGLSVGMYVYGAAIPPGDTIATITNSTAITLTSAVTSALIFNDYLTFYTTPIPMWNPVIVSTDSIQSIQRIIVNDQSGSSKTTAGAYVVVSFGPNGHGGYPRYMPSGATPSNYSRISSGSQHPDEQSNCDCDNNAVSYNPIPGGTFVQEQPNYSGNIGDPMYYFDDVVAFATRSDLRSPNE